ncbi:MAG TPA: ribosome biogenesis GTP-binding protein YihA/YsxC [Stellaceae bacterium]|nr:ribosome biogenesis GTP-binding protein YihA/YsxC [Stellaceae bacterium]
MAPAAGVPSDVVYPPAEAPDAAGEEAGRRLFAGACDFVAGAAVESALPPDGLPEIAFAGRSNVGKSSLVNALTGRTTLARISHRPGRTQQLNFFDLAGRLMLVDLPGYGFAEVSKRDIQRWTSLIHRYLRGRASLRRTLLLIDARHGIKEADRPLLKLLDEAAVSFQVVLTKIDKVKPAELADRIAAVAAELARHVAAHPVIHLTSAHEGIGIAALRGSLSALAAPAQSR